MNAPLPSVAVSATLVEIAKSLGLHKTSAVRRAGRESWPFDETATRGGRLRLYPLDTLPADVKAAVKHSRQVGKIVSRGAPMRALTTMLLQFQADEAAAVERRAEQAESALRDLACLSERASATLAARSEIATSWQAWFHKAQPPMKRSASWGPFARAYNLAEIPVSEATRATCKQTSARSVQRFVGVYEDHNLSLLVDKRNGAGRRGKTLFNAVPLLAAAARKLMLDRPGIRPGQLHALLQTAAIDAKTGETLFAAPSYDQVSRYQALWIEEHRELYLQATNPDAWKNSCLLAFGSCSEDVTALNQRWEMDATPADWLLLDRDGKKKRWTVSVIVDVWSRRMLVVVSRTPKTVTHCHALRLALLLWGVPQEILTDNGQDYQSEHFKRALLALGITHRTTNPFSPEEKPHVERAIGTLNHSILELLPHFSGHSVAERKAIEARRSFADRLARKGELVDFGELGIEAMSGEVLQAQINTWLAGIYEQREHASLAGRSPFAQAASWSGETRRIRDERSLDVLLAKPADGGQRTLQKKGLRLDGTWFQAPELARIDVGSVVDIFETPDLGRVVVYFRKNFLCIAEAPERTGADRQQMANTASQIKREWLAEQRQRVKAESKGLAPTAEVMARHLAEQAAAAGKLVQGEFGKTASTHHSHGLSEAGKAAAALAGPKPSSRAAELSAEAARAMQAAPQNVVAMPSSAVQAHATPLEGMSAAERYALWRQYDALVQAHAGDVEVLEESWQRRFSRGYPRTAEFRAQAALAEAQREARGG